MWCKFSKKHPRKKSNKRTTGRLSLILQHIYYLILKLTKAIDNHPDYLRTPETISKPDRCSLTTYFLDNKPVTVAY